MGQLQAFDPATGTWEVITTTGPIGAPGPQGEQGEQGIQGVPGGAVVRYRSPYVNTWVSDTSTTALKTVFTAEVEIPDPTGDYMVVAGWRAIADVGAVVGMAQLEVKVGSWTAPTHSVFSAGENETLWGGVSRVWFPTGSEIAAAPGPVTATMKMILNVASKTVYDPSFYVVQLNSADTGGGGGYLPLAGGTLTGPLDVNSSLDVNNAYASIHGDGYGVLFQGDARIYKRVGGGLVIREHADLPLQVESTDGTTRHNVLDTGNVQGTNYDVTWENGFSGGASFRVSPAMVALSIGAIGRSENTAVGTSVRMFTYPAGVAAPWTQINTLGVIADASSVAGGDGTCHVEAKTDGVYLKLFNTAMNNTNHRLYGVSFAWPR